MRHISLTPFGRGRATLAHVAAEAGAPAPALDKWKLLGRLRTARTRFGLGDRDLAVLHALLSFLPARELRDGEALVVFPSNTALGERAHGMAESTLRRHIARLVAAGVLGRRDSPNGKRFAQRSRTGELRQAFGLDLRPLLLAAQRIEDAAQVVEDELRALREARARVIIMLRDATKLTVLARDLACEPAADLEPMLHTVRQGLRRKSCADRLAALEAVLQGVLDQVQERLDTQVLSGNDAQTERHLQDSDSETPEPERGKEGSEGYIDGAAPTGPRMPLALVLKACPAMRAYHDGPWRGWDDLERAADRVAPWLGIDAATWRRARTCMGATTAAATLAAMVERASAIHNPGGYLRSLTDRFEAGQFAIGPMIMALLRPAPGAS